MPMTTINLTEENSEKLEAIARRTGKSRDELLNEAVEKLVDTPELQPASVDWKAALMQAAGMWKDRDDLPDFEEIRRSWDRKLWGDDR
jgi:predicted transcriptional regulator